MNDEELDRLADAIARALIAGTREASATDSQTRGTWLQSPVRPEPPARGGEPPAWSGAAQQLDDVAPSGGSHPSAHRVSTAELTVATRAAAAGRGDARAPQGRPRATPGARRRGIGEGSLEVSIGVSNRHAHLSPEHVRELYGTDSLVSERPLSQPGQFAASGRLEIFGLRGTLHGVRVVGPPRGRTQLELAPSDCRALGIEPPVRASGALEGSVGGVTVTGPAGSVRLDRGVIIAARHLHLSEADSRRWGIRDGDLVDIRCGIGARSVTFHQVLVRAGSGHATELHLDTDEALAAGVRTGDRAVILSWRAAPAERRPLVTERDVLRHAQSGVPLPDHAILTPSARDRARAVGLLRE